MALWPVTLLALASTIPAESPVVPTWTGTVTLTQAMHNGPAPEQLAVTAWWIDAATGPVFQIHLPDGSWLDVEAAGPDLFGVSLRESGDEGYIRPGGGTRDVTVLLADGPQPTPVEVGRLYLAAGCDITHYVSWSLMPSVP